MKIADLDKNMKIHTSIQEPDIVFRHMDEAPFEVLGVSRYEDHYIRMDATVAKSVSEPIYNLAQHTSGGRVRFMTDSAYIALSCKVPQANNMYHATRAMQSGFDVYADGVFQYVLASAEGDHINAYEGITYFPDKKMREIVINLPLYNSVNDLYIGLDKNSSLSACKPYEKSMVFYGSSITQGGCASRPGNCYTSVVAREMGWDYLNLGFSGNAKGEQMIAEYIAKLSMDLFVYDYDHNAPDADHLARTHKPFFDTIRKAQPHLPVIMLTRPDHRRCDDTHLRKEVVYDTYLTAKKAGDQHVYFLSGETMIGNYGYDSCFVDGCHPTDMGFFRMAEAVLNKIKSAGIR